MFYKSQHAHSPRYSTNEKGYYAGVFYNRKKGNEWIWDMNYERDQLNK